MNIIIESALETLQKSKYLLTNLSNEQLSNESVAPYYSSIGSHIRHILDFYDCILNIDSKNRVDLTARSRNKSVELCCEKASDYFDTVTDRLKKVDFNVNDTVMVTDDLGLGRIIMPYTIAAVLSQANSHTIHHYAIINYVLYNIGIDINDTNFGYNPTTPKQEIII